MNTATDSNVTVIQPQQDQFISMIERVVLNPQTDVEKLDRMLAMQERILDRTARMEYDEAMAKLQAELPEVEKRASTDKAKYAKFEHILAAIKPALVKHGFSITHRTKNDNDSITITAILGHRGGHREETSLVLPSDKTGSKNAVQAIGSSVEYGRRYTMNSLLGIATKDADNDGGRSRQAENQHLVNRTMIGSLRGVMKKVGVSEDDFCRMARIESIEQLERSRYPAAIASLEAKAKQADGDKQ